MATQKHLVFNCGASHVTAARFEGGGQELVMSKLANRSLDYDYTQEERWIPAILAAMRSIVHDDGLGGKAHVILPGFLLLTKIFRIAHVDERKRTQMIAFEAQQNMPYPLSEVVWTHEVLSDDGIETEVLFIAVKREIVGRLCDEMGRVGVTPVSVGASTVLDRNAFRYVFGDGEGDALIVNIGARGSNLTFISDDGFFVRNINYGGNALTQGVADATGSDFGPAEQSKLKHFSGEGLIEGSLVEAIDKRATEFQRKIGQEITRSIVSYRQQRKAPAPKRILLAGKGSLLPGLAEYLEQAQKATVESFDLAGHVTLGDGIVLGEDRIAVTEMFGLVASLTGGGGSFVHVDLLPSDIRQRSEFKKKLPFLLVAALGVAVAPFPLALAYGKAAEAKTDELKRGRIVETELRQQFGAVEEKLSLLAEREDLVSRFENLQNSRYNWIRLFSSLQLALYEAGDAWLDELEVIREQAKPSSTGEAPDPEFRLRLAGRMLVREAGSEVVLGRDDIIREQELLTSRIRTLSEKVETLELVDTRLSFRIDFQSVGEGLPLLPFELVYRVLPETEL